MSKENDPQADLTVCKTGTVGAKINAMVEGCKCFLVVGGCLAQQEMVAK